MKIDGNLVEKVYEYGIKLSHMGQFIYLGTIVIPVEDIALVQNDPEFLETLMAETELMVHEQIITTIRPIFVQDYE